MPSSRCAPTQQLWRDRPFDRRLRSRRAGESTSAGSAARARPAGRPATRARYGLPQFTILVPLHTPAVHWSFVVQKLPSLQVVPSSRLGKTQRL